MAALKKRALLPCLVALLVASFWAPIGRTQSSPAGGGGQSNYIFRFNTGISAVFLDTMTFASDRSLDLGTCTANEKVNGPLACVVNCDGASVCLLEVSGPSGASVNDVMEKASETPITGSASPGPAVSPSPAGASAFGNLAGTGTWFEISKADSSSESTRIMAYNGARR